MPEFTEQFVHPPFPKYPLMVWVERISAPPLQCSTAICRENSGEIVLHYNGAPLQCSTISPEFSLQISVLHCNGGADIRSTPNTGWGMFFGGVRLLWTMMIFQKKLLSFSSLSLVYGPYGVGDVFWRWQITMNNDDISKESTVIFIIELGIWPIRACPNFIRGGGRFLAVLGYYR